MIGNFNIEKFLTENKLTVASKNLNELDVQDPAITGSVKEFYELQQEMATMKSRLKEMEGRFKEFEGVIKPMLDDMKELGDKLANAGEFMIKVTKFGGERLDASYKDAFENALSKVNAATKNVLNEALEASKKVTQVKHSISIQPAEQLEEGVMDRIKAVFGKIAARFTQKVDIAAKAVEDFINVAADILPGGEDVDDTPNPVLEGANNFGFPDGTVVKEKKSGGSAPKAAGEKNSNPFEKKEETEEGEEDIDSILEEFKELSKEGQMKLAQKIAKHLKPKEKKEDKKPNPFEKKEEVKEEEEAEDTEE